MSTISSPYDEQYYTQGFGPDPYQRNDHWLAFFNGVARELVRAVSPRSVFDAGCALGMLVESFWDLGVSAEGADISEYAISQVRPDMAAFCRVGSVTDPINKKYDLITCIEVLEHVEFEQAELAIEAFVAATDTILFSSSPNDFVEPTHVNVRPPIAWIRSFAKRGFRADLRFDASFLAPHAMLFRKVGAYGIEEVEELYALHILLRTALVEREQRIGNLMSQNSAMASKLEVTSAEFESERERLTAEVEGERERLAAALSQRANVDDERAASARSREAERRRADTAIERLGVLEHERAAAERESKLLYERLQASARSEAATSSLLAKTLAELAYVRSQMTPVSPDADLEVLVRSRADLEARYRAVLEADIEFFEAENARLR